MIRKCSFLLALCLLFSTAAAQTGSFKGQLALQLYSLRAELKQDVPGTLAKVKAMGFRNVEMGGYFGLTPQQFRAELDKAGLKAVSMHADFNLLDKDIERVVTEAKILEVSYVGCAWIPHGKDFTPADVTRAAEVFNRAGARLQGAGFKFMYHIHGYEFVKDGEGTLFDRLAAATDARTVYFENDIFWTTHGGADPAKLLLKYPQRFRLLHLKDMKKGTVGNLTGHAPDETSVALGTGQVDVKGVLVAGRKIGIEWYIIEEESPEPLINVPAGKKYLETVRY
ncbi:MAG: sugar phosphate isomerase/epimerase family protein [Blastocatellia bacterium]|jgi:sugar phosphate isomerase/epimerase